MIMAKVTLSLTLCFELMDRVNFKQDTPTLFSLCIGMEHVGWITPGQRVFTVTDEGHTGF